MDTPTSEVLCKALENDEIEKIPSDIAKKLEKYYESRNEDYMNTKVLYDTIQQSYETLRQENDQLTSNAVIILGENEALKLSATDLQNKMEATSFEVTRLTQQMTLQESELNVYRKEKNDLVDERDQLRKIGGRKDCHIDHLNGSIKYLDEQLQSAVAAKYDALSRLDVIEGKEQAIDRKEREWELEKEHLNMETANLRDNLNRHIAELMALRQETTSTTVQCDIDLKQKTEELRTANATINRMTETNQSLTNQCEENIQKLKEQMVESGRLIDHYQKELDSKIKLTELYKENCDDYQAQVNELGAAVKELQRLLNEATDECGIFETKLKQCNEQHQLNLDGKDEIIAQMKHELKVANEMLEKADEEHSERIVENYMPSANAMHRRLKSGLTFTEICARYFNLEEQVKVKDQDYNNLKLQFETVFQDIQEKAPEFERLQVEYKKAVSLNEELTRKIDDYISERVVIRDELTNNRSKFGYLERENAKLKTSRTDLARQVCYLLNEIECSRGGTSSDQDQSISSDMPANEVITNKLVTFNNIIEMQENNEKLLLLVRDFSTKLEEMEEIQNSIDIETYESKCASYEKRLQDAEQSRRANEELLGNCLKEKERYKQMVCDLMKDCNKPIAGDHTLHANMDAMEVGDTSGVNGSLGASKEVKDKKLADFEQMLEDKVKQLKELRDEYQDYRNESKNTVKSLNEQFLAVRNESRELTSANCKLLAQANFANEQIKAQQNNVGIYKNKIQSLEERNQMHEKTIAKHETAGKYIRDEAMNTAKKLSTLEGRFDNLQRENNRLLTVKLHLEVKLESLSRERTTNSTLQNNLEMIKGSFERLETESRAKMEQRLDDASRECSALRRRLQEEQDYYRVQIATIKSQTENSEKKMSEQALEVETLRSQLKYTQEQIEVKNQQLTELAKKLENLSTMSHIDIPVDDDSQAKLKAFEVQVINAAVEVEKLRSEISFGAEREARLRQVATEWEEEALKQKNSFDTWKAKMSVDLEKAQLCETMLKAKVEELQTEIRMQAMETDSSMFDAAAENKARVELKEALQKIGEKEREIRDLQSEFNQLKIDLQTIEQKYSNEMQVHSSDLQTLAMCKDELNKCQEQIDQVRAQKADDIELLKASLLESDGMNKKLHDDKMELELKLEFIDKQNTAMHDQLQTQHNKAGSSNDSMNESVNSSFLNRSLTDDEAKEISSEKLLKVITFLRKEKDCSVAKVEILKNENTRLLSQYEYLKKRVDELSLQLNAVKSPNVPNVLSATKYEELMRKVETLNAVTESNIHLRTEKDALTAKVKDLTERVSKLEDELFPLQEKNRELLGKTEEQAQINQILKSNVEHWRKRSSDLVERNNKNPEDFKRLQNERESLAKMLTSEKENLRKVNEEFSSMKSKSESEKTKMEQDLAASLRQLHTTMDEKKKSQDDLNALKQQNVRLTQEIIEIKSQILKKEDDIKAVQNELEVKDKELNDIKNKEVQIRRIAKKYKDSYNEAKKEIDSGKADLAAKSLEEQAAASTVAGSAGLAAARAEMEKVQTKKLEDLSNQLVARQEEIEQLRKEIENLKKQDDKNLLADARNRIAALTETNRQISRDFQTSKNQLQTCEQSRSEHDSLVASLKSQLEAKIKELLDQDASRQEAVARLTRENETLNTRVNQLHRQLQQQGSKPSTSSGTIEKSPSDPARTANVKPMATPSAQQSATVNPRRGGDTPLASIRPMSVQNSRTAAVLPTSQTSNVVAVQGSSSGSVTTALVPPQQQVHTTGNTSTAEAMSSSPTSSHTDYMPATSSAVVVAVPPMGSTSAESTQEAESLSVNTNESSSSSSTSSQAVLQQQTVALVSPRVEVAPQNVLIPSQQVVDQNQAASTSGSSSSFLTAMSSHHQASSSNTVTTTQAGGHKRPRDAEGDSSTGVEESSASEKTSPQNKRTRLGEQTFQGVSESGLDVEYQVPTSSQRDQEDDVVAVDSEDDDDEGMDDETAADVDENFDGDNGDTDEIESFGQDEGEGHDIDEDNVPNDNNEVDVDDSSDAPNQSSSGVAVSSGARVNLVEVIEMSPLGQETQQIQTISSGSDAGPSGQANLWRQAQTPSRQQQQQQNLIIQQAYEEVTDDSIVPSTPTLYVARRADGFSEAVSSPHPTVPHGSRFTFGDSGASRTNVPSLNSSIEGMDDTRVDLNLLDGSGDNGQSSSVTTPAQNSDNQQIVVVDLSDDNSNENKEADQKQPVAGPSGQGEGSVPQIMVTDAENNQNNFDESASTSHLTDDKSIPIEADAQDEEDIETDGVSSGQDGMQVEEGREAEASQMTTDKRTTRQTRHKEDNQRLTPIVWDGADGRDQQASPQHRGISNRGSLIRGQSTSGGRGSRGRAKRHS